MEAIPGKIDLLKNFIKCEEIAYMKLPTFKFIDHSGRQAFTLSYQNYFVDLNNNACSFAVRPSPSNVWVIGATLAKTHPIVFEDESAYIL